MQIRGVDFRSAQVDGFVRQLDMPCMAIGVTENGDRTVAQLTGRFENTAGDFTAVGDQYLVKTHARHPLERPLGAAFLHESQTTFHAVSALYGLRKQAGSVVEIGVQVGVHAL